MKKIFIYEAEVLRKRVQFQDKVVNYVKLTRPEGLEEHWPEAGDIINLYFHDDIFYMKHKVIGKKNDGIYIVELRPVDEIKYDVKVENLKDEGLESLLNLPIDINNEIKGLSKLTMADIDLDKSLNLYFDISKNIIDDEHFYEFIKRQVIRTIKDYIKDIDVWVDPYHCGTGEVYKNEPFIEEVIDKDYNANDGIIRFKGIIEKEFKNYRLYIRTNIYKN